MKYRKQIKIYPLKLPQSINLIYFIINTFYTSGLEILMYLMTTWGICLK